VVFWALACGGRASQSGAGPSAPGPNALRPDLIAIFGGKAEDTARDVAVAGDGSIYLTGGTASPGFQTTSGAAGASFNGRHDVYVMKLDPDGAVAWSTLIGGRNYDRAYAIETDEKGFVYVAGRAGADFPTTPGVLQPDFQGGPSGGRYGSQDGFLCKISADGRQRVFCTYFGGPDESIIRDLAVDPRTGEIFVVSALRSGALPPAIATRFVNAARGGDDVVVAKIAADGSRVIWARYLGGTKWEGNEAVVRTDAAGAPYVLLTTRSADIETTPGAFDRTLGGPEDFYVAKMDPADGKLLWATYLGGDDVESTETHELAVGPDGSAIVAAGSHSPQFPTSRTAVQRTYGGGVNDIVVARLSSDGTRLIASTFFGGSGHDRAEGVATDTAGNVYLTGTTTSVNFPVSANAAQPALAGSRDAIALGLSPNLDRVLYSSYLGGSGEEFGRSASVGPGGLVAFGGQTASVGWAEAKLLAGSQQGDLDALVAVFHLSAEQATLKGRPTIRAEKP
jgi:hypothetical protein